MKFIRKIREKVSSMGSYSKNISVLITGTAIGQILPALVQIYLPKLYTREQIGEWGLVNMVCSILLVVTTFLYEQAIMLPENDDDAFSLSVGATIISAFMSLVWLIVLLIRPVRNFFGTLFNANEFTSVLPWVSLFVFFSAGYQITNYWVNRKGMYKQLSGNRVIKALSISGISLGMGFPPLNTMFNGVVIGRIAGEGISWLGLLLRVWRKELDRFKRFSFKNSLKQLKRYIKFPTLIVPARFINVCAQYVPTMLLTTYYGIATQGDYTTTYTVLALPISLIARAIGDVFRESASNIYNKQGECKELYLKTFKKLAVFAAVPFLLIAIFGPMVFDTFYGEKWVLAGEFTRILAPAFYVMFVVTPFTFMFMIAERQEFELYWQIGFIILTSGGFLAGYHLFGSPQAALIGYTAGHAIMHIINGIFSYKLACGKYRTKSVRV